MPLFQLQIVCQRLSLSCELRILSRVDVERPTTSESMTGSIPVGIARPFNRLTGLLLAMWRHELDRWVGGNPSNLKGHDLVEQVIKIGKVLGLFNCMLRASVHLEVSFSLISLQLGGELNNWRRFAQAKWYRISIRNGRLALFVLSCLEANKVRISTCK